MKALAVYESEKMELRDISQSAIQSHEIALQVGAVGLCGTDFHIYEGKANYNFDTSGRRVPLSEQAQILGHEFCGTVVEIGADVQDLQIGDRVIVDQGLNCSSRHLPRHQWCEYCRSGDSHQCLQYKEHGITGQQGALAEFIVVPAVNAIRIESDLPMSQAALCEPLGCILHASELQMKTSARFTFGGEHPINSVLICGAGPAGLLFTQYLRNVVGYTKQLIVSEPSEQRRHLAESYGAITIDPTTTDLVEAVQDLTHGERVQYLIESAGVAQIFPQIPGVLRKQGTLMMYGHGHFGVDLGVMNSVQFLEPTILCPGGASGALDQHGKPVTPAKALDLLSGGLIDVSRFITHQYTSLEMVPQAFTQDRFDKVYIKGVAVFDN
ncbi:MAG: alcohol dehydrogenase catalytic domain-containing protein [Blastocatellia bacterium]|nr:alcohol dehydrogenase catalytic domain-containing protein [Blastocatellia bacterium]